MVVPSPSTPRVAVIGAGLGGLALAHGLKKASIPVEVYERDAGPDIRAQGYRLSLKASGAAALRECLPAHLFDLAAATSIRQATRMVFMNEGLTPFLDKELPLLPVPDGGFGVNRLTLREILASGLEDDIRFDKAFDRFESGGGIVRAWFEDGSGVDADLLVGADGSGSRVRRQLLPSAGADHLGYALYGRTPIGPDTLDWLPAVLTDTFNRVTSTDGTAMSVVTCRPREPYADALARIAPEVALTEVADYLSWTISLDVEALREADPGELHAWALSLVDGWHPALGRVVREADIESTFLVDIRSARRVDGWSDGRVTLLGDAIHTMSPGRGDGANIALRDAELLAHRITSAMGGRISLGQAKAEYEADMLDYGFAAVEASRDRPFSSLSGAADREPPPHRGDRSA